MGAGKSTVGKLLAKKLGWEFIDTDKETEREMGMNIPRAFQEIGERGFREAEEKVIIRLLKESAIGEKGRVISLGGGAVTIQKVYDLTRREPFVFFLKIDIDAAYNRVSKKGRPLAKDLKSFRDLYLQREPLYLETASHIVEIRNMESEEIASKIVQLIREGGR